MGRLQFGFGASGTGGLQERKRSSERREERGSRSKLEIGELDSELSKPVLCEDKGVNAMIHTPKAV